MRQQVWICNLCLSVAARTIVSVDPFLTYAGKLLGREAANKLEVGGGGWGGFLGRKAANKLKGGGGGGFLGREAANKLEGWGGGFLGRKAANKLKGGGGLLGA